MTESADRLVAGVTLPPWAAQVAYPGHPSPAGIAQLAASRHDVDLPYYVAEEIARDVLAYADDEYRVTAEVHPQYWPEARERLLSRLRYQLAFETAEQQLLPTALPREVVTNPPSGRPWENVKVELVVPVRRPRG